MYNINFLDESNIETEQVQNLNLKSESPQSIATNQSTTKQQLNDENDEDQEEEEEEFDAIENDEENNETTVLSNQQIGSDSSSLDCKICNKQFDNLHRLQRHAMSHDQNPELRKFKCEFCNKAFKFKHHLKVCII